MVYTANDHVFVICAYKKSQYLEDCIQSLKAQTIKTEIIMTTSTPNDYITELTNKYDIPLYINNGETGIGGDWNFGYNQAQKRLITIAHQDDIYEPTYTQVMLEKINKSRDPIIFFSHYSELRGQKKVYKNKLLNIKRIMLSPLNIFHFQHSRFVRRRVLSLGNPICCPSVTFVFEKVGDKPFANNFKSDLDWEMWEILSRKKGSFVYDSRPLMCHRVHEESTTSELINADLRTKEDYQMYLKFWPKCIANILIRFYSTSQNSNNSNLE